MLLVFCSLPVLAQVTGPSAIDFPAGPYQTATVDQSGSALSWYGWSLAKKSYLNRPARVSVRVDSIGGRIAKFRYISAWAGLSDTLYLTWPRYAAFWLPDTGYATNGIPDSLFYVVPDSTGMSVGDEFTISSLKVQAADLYNVRLLYANDTVKGTQELSSQPVWIADGVAALAFAYQAKSDTTRAVYRTSYANAWGGPYLYFLSSDTLADTTWTKARLAGAWNYRTITATVIDAMRWMKVDRIGNVAADTLVISGEQVYIRSK